MGGGGCGLVTGLVVCIGGGVIVFVLCLFIL